MPGIRRRYPSRSKLGRFGRQVIGRRSTALIKRRSTSTPRLAMSAGPPKHTISWDWPSVGATAFQRTWRSVRTISRKSATTSGYSNSSDPTQNSAKVVRNHCFSISSRYSFNLSRAVAAHGSAERWYLMADKVQPSSRDWISSIRFSKFSGSADFVAHPASVDEDMPNKTAL